MPRRRRRHASPSKPADAPPAHGAPSASGKAGSPGSGWHRLAGPLRALGVAVLAVAAAWGAWGCTRSLLTERGALDMTLGHPDGPEWDEPQFLAEILPLRARGFTFRAEVARTAEERERGLMRRPPLADDGAMLFVYPDRSKREFWMKDTPSPLSIAFISDHGVIVSIQDMVPLDERLTVCETPVRLALEVRRGRLDELGVRAGDVVEWDRSPFAAPPAAPGGRTAPGW